MPFPFSILDLMPIPNGGDGAQAIHNTLDLAHLADELGYTRYWLAEHHNFPGLAAVAPEVLIGAIARETRRIRVGSGGILPPNPRAGESRRDLSHAAGADARPDRSRHRPRAQPGSAHRAGSARQRGRA